jgi:hypothetical protein
MWYARIGWLRYLMPACAARTACGTHASTGTARLQGLNSQRQFCGESRSRTGSLLGVVLLLALIPTFPALAENCPVYPNTLTNGTTADANQVMGNFNSILNCANASLAPTNSPVFSNTITTTGSGIAVQALNPSSTAYTGYRIFNDQSSIFRALEIDYAGSAYPSSLQFGGVIGEAAAVTATGPYPLMLGTNNTTRITILGAGNVGIGTITPDALLSTSNGNVHIGNSSTANQSGLIFDRGAAPTNASMQASISDVWNGGLPGNNEAFVFNVGAPGALDDYRFKTAGTDRLVISGVTGDVGVATTSPAYPLDVAGDIRTSTCIHYSGGFSGVCTSDVALKRDVTPFTLGLRALASLRPVNFYFNGLGENPDDGVQQLGLVAQDVQATVPELVGTRLVKLHPSDAKPFAIKTVNYAALTYMLVNAVRELKASNDRYAAQLDVLRARVASLERQSAIRAAWVEVHRP